MLRVIAQQGVRASLRPAEIASSSGYARALLAYGIALPVLLLLAPALLRAESGLMRGFTLQEVADLFTPVVLLPLFAIALLQAGALGRGTLVAFAAIAAIWVSGQAMHLAANAIGDAAVEAGAGAYAGSVPGQLGEWLDEVLSHWLWHVAWVALLLLLAWSTRPSRALGDEGAAGGTLARFGGALQGFTWFWVTVEGVTAALGIPAALAFLGIGFVSRRGGGTSGLTATFLAWTGGVALVGYVAWAVVNGGTLPEFSHWTPPW